ncbi:hypothetical protein N7447_008228 [Penicillium robsamsonii]|uniref:uncharacterized protein n=1 Tax=Penicillium robsamsonii TaxID=1792511 RepID=UPI002548508E|nr:uncharacterized protein N7447_008228 [Penicillium robsamsonii]KAJ5815995.1 hypothetical protein N7447_008228 [Penicillium robsamsonii]
MIDAAFIEGLGVGVQEPDAVAQSVALLFSDQKRHEDVIYNWEGNYLEVNKAEGGLLATADGILVNSVNEESVVRKFREGNMLG